MKSFFSTVAILLPSVSFALLSPYYQSISEMEAIFKSEELESALGQSSMIESIEKNKQGYLIQNKTDAVQVDIEYNYSGKIGPAEFSLKFHPATKK